MNTLLKSHDIWKLVETGASTKPEDQKRDTSDSQPRFFMAKIGEETDFSQIWFLDSGCSKHMTGFKHLFEELDESYKKTVKLGDDKEISVEGKGRVAVQTNHNTWLLHDVYYIPQLSKSLLSIGQMMDNGYTIHFEGENCRIVDADSDQTMATIKKTKNNLFPLETTTVKCKAHADIAVPISDGQSNAMHPPRQQLQKSSMCPPQQKLQMQKFAMWQQQQQMQQFAIWQKQQQKQLAMWQQLQLQQSAMFSLALQQQMQQSAMCLPQQQLLLLSSTIHPPRQQQSAPKTPQKQQSGALPPQYPQQQKQSGGQAA